MGNCQAVDAAALVIQHPCGKTERLYWPVTASEVMKMNPGHYVSLIIPLPVSEEVKQVQHPVQQEKTVRFTRVKLLRPNETLNLGHAYRLITSQEVMKVIRAKKYAKTRRAHSTAESADKSQKEEEEQHSGLERPGDKSEIVKAYQAMKAERRRQRTAPVNATIMRSKSWRPSLQSISESPIRNN